MKKIKNFLLDNMFFTVTVLVVFGVFMGLVVGNVIETSINNKRINQAEVTKNSNAPSNKITTDTQTIIVFNKTFEKVNYKTHDEVLIPKDKTSMTQDELQKEYPTWDIDSFSKSKVVMSKTIDSYPPGYYKISYMYNIDSEYITVFTYDKEGREKVYKITKTPLDLLDAQTIKQIKKGIIISDKEELNRTLENYVD